MEMNEEQEINVMNVEKYPRYRVLDSRARVGGNVEFSLYLSSVISVTDSIDQGFPLCPDPDDDTDLIVVFNRDLPICGAHLYRRYEEGSPITFYEIYNAHRLTHWRDSSLFIPEDVISMIIGMMQEDLDLIGSKIICIPSSPIDSEDPIELSSDEKITERLSPVYSLFYSTFEKIAQMGYSLYPEEIEKIKRTFEQLIPVSRLCVTVGRKSIDVDPGSFGLREISKRIYELYDGLSPLIPLSEVEKCMREGVWNFANGDEMIALLDRFPKNSCEMIDKSGASLMSWASGYDLRFTIELLMRGHRDFTRISEYRANEEREQLQASINKWCSIYAELKTCEDKLWEMIERGSEATKRVLGSIYNAVSHLEPIIFIPGHQSFTFNVRLSQSYVRRNAQEMSENEILTLHQSYIDLIRSLDDSDSQFHESITLPRGTVLYLKGMERN